MSSNNWAVVVVGLGLFGACGDGSDSESTGDGKVIEYAMETVTLSEDLVIAKGETVRVGPGVTFSAQSEAIKIDVFGTLIVEGTEAAPSIFSGGSEPESWHGIVIEEGGKLTVQHAQISGAKYGMFAMPGSSFSVDHAVIDTSFKAAVVETSDGTFTHTTFKAVPLFPAITDAVSVDDPNGCLTIIDASPSITDCRFEGSGGLNDMIRIGGMSSPTFDRVHVEKSHCGFHMSGGVNTAPRITNTVFDTLAYGIMAYTMKPIVEGSVFRNNDTDVGICSDADGASPPQLSNNFYQGGAVKLDASCDRIGTKDTGPATAENPAAGPSGL